MNFQFFLPSFALIFCFCKRLIKGKSSRGLRLTGEIDENILIYSSTTKRHNFPLVSSQSGPFIRLGSVSWFKVLSIVRATRKVPYVGQSHSFRHGFAKAQRSSKSLKDAFFRAWTIFWNRELKLSQKHFVGELDLWENSHSLKILLQT